MRDTNIKWKSCFKIGVSCFLLYLCIHYLDNVVKYVGLAVGAALPIIIGCVLAYILNIVMSFYEKLLLKRKHNRKYSTLMRALSIIASILTLALVIAFVFIMIVPELVSCVKLFAEKLPGAIDTILKNEIVAKNIPENIFQSLDSVDWKSITAEFGSFLTSGIAGTIGTIAGIVYSVVSSLITWLVSFIFALYILASKEKITSQLKRLFKAYTKPLLYNRVKHVIGVLDDCFHKYIVGQCAEAIILGTLCVIGMLLFRFPYAVMIGVLIGFTALIPIAGAYIGAAVGAFMILTVSPVKAILFLLFIVILQQLEGNLIYPKVVGSSIGLPGIWVLAAVIVGGGVVGVLGMLVGVPLSAAAYRLLRADISKKEKNEVLCKDTAEGAEDHR